jgi:hypothetical protein
MRENLGAGMAPVKWIDVGTNGPSFDLSRRREVELVKA